MRFRHSLQNDRMILWMVGIVICMALGCFGGERPVSAAGANVSITTKKTTVTEGDVVYVLITVKSSQEISGFEGFFPYDNRVLQFQTGGSVVYGNDNEFRIEDVEREAGSKQIKYSIKFLARREGNTTITLKKPYNVFGENTSDKLSVSYNSLTIVVKKKDDQNAAPAPTADPQVQGTQTVQPSASPAQPEPSATPVKKKKKKKKPKATEIPEETPVAAGQQKDMSENGVHAVSSNEGILLYGASSIQITEPEADQIPQGFGKTELELDGQTVTAYALESNTEHTYVLVYGQSGDQEAFYLYDREQNTLMPYDKVRAWYRSNSEGIVSERESQAELKAKRLQYVTGILLAFSALMLLAVISLYMKYKGFNPDELETNSEIDDEEA